MLALVAEVQRSAGITETSLLNFVVSDGRTLIASRCVFPEHDAAASLYYSEGAAFERSVGGDEGDAHSEAAEQSDAARRIGGTQGHKAPMNPASARDSSVTGKADFQPKRYVVKVLLHRIKTYPQALHSEKLDQAADKCRRGSIQGGVFSCRRFKGGLGCQ